MRLPPKLPTPAVASSDARIVDTRTYRFLTPVFGGGVHIDPNAPQLKPADPVTPVRVPSIRGQLRFWWRACNPRGLTDRHQLLEQERAIFGGVHDKAKPSSVLIRVVRQLEAPKAFKVLEGKFDSREGLKNLAYGAFPLRDKAGNHGTLHDYGEQSFSLELRYPKDIEGDVRAALWAWGHFGALGGRTRRGFGALAHLEGQLESLEAGWRTHVRGCAVEWPHLSAKPEVSVRAPLEFDRGLDAQQHLLGLMRKLRQGENCGRNKGASKTPGRSRWPEPDKIRALTRKSDPRHSKRETEVPKFPRAAFGLPIIFHFKDKSDPPDTQLLPQGGNRLASRLLLRPHLKGDGKVEAMAVALEAGKTPKLVLKLNEREFPVPVEATLVSEEAHSLRPLKTESRTFTDPVERYLDLVASTTSKESNR